jgi:hypothetical protein
VFEHVTDLGEHIPDVDKPDQFEIVILFALASDQTWKGGN